MFYADITKQYSFNTESSVRYASLILGLIEIEGDIFLLYVDSVYLQSPFPPNNIGIYQIATIDYLPYSRVVTNRQLEIINTMKTVLLNPFSKFLSSVSIFPLNAISHFLSRNTKVVQMLSLVKLIFGTIV